MILRSLAWQLANVFPQYAEKLQQLESVTADLRTANFRTIWQWLYRQTLFHLDRDRPLYIVIDGLDEAESPGDLVRLFADLQLTSLPLRVLIVSRKTHEISSAWMKLGRQAHTEIIRTEGSRDDFRSYIDQEMDVAGEESYREDVTNKLLEQARGNFLWVHLAVQRINSCHTTMEVEEALANLPPGMEGLYDRMAASVQTQAARTNERQSLGQMILGWAACAQRSLSVEELSDALKHEGLIEIHRTIGDLCGGFVVVDIEDKVSMIHETAREYLTRSGDDFERPIFIDRKATHHLLFKRCIDRLTDPALRSLVTRNKDPALLDYATRFWFVHLSSCIFSDSDALFTAVRFLKTPHVLTWISIIAKTQELRTLVVASRYLTDIVTKLRRAENGKALEFHKAINTVEGWATDLVKVVGKFGNSLLKSPDSILKLIPPFCPENSMIFQQFGRKESKSIYVGGSSNRIWDDCLARFSMEEGFVASAVVTGGSRIAILATIRKSSYINLYDAITFEQQRRIAHPERVTNIQINYSGSLLVSYGYLTTRVWDTATGDCVKVLQNPARRPRPHTMRFVDDDRAVLVGGEDRCIRAFSLNEDNESEWHVKANIEEQSLEGTTLNFPMCSELSPDGTMIAFGYRSYPLTVWELEPPMLIGHCSLELDETDMTIQDSTFGEVFRVAWHPLSDERQVFGLTQIGMLLKWSPYDEWPSATVQTGAQNIKVSEDGSLIATGDAVGAVKVFSTVDLSLLYQLSSQNSVTSISFSTDGRRLYDVRGSYGNVWQPNTLARLAESSEYPDHNSDSTSEAESLTKFSLQPEHHFVRVDSLISLAGQSVGSLYCYGTEDGVAVLCETGRGRVCEIERLASFMSIEQVAWSEDGRLVAITDLSGRLSIKRIARTRHDRDYLQVDQEFEIQLPPEHGHVTQLFFHFTRKQVFASTPNTLFLVDMESGSLKQTELRPEVRALWVCHPALPDYLLGFGNTGLHIFDWSTLEEIESESRVYFPPRMGGRAPTLSLGGTFHRSGSSSKQDREALGRLVVSGLDQAHVLLQLWASDASGGVKAEYLIFDINDLCKKAPEAGNVNQLPYSTVPTEVASCIREPLAFMSRGRLVFLSHERWICTWRLPSAVPRKPALSRPGGDKVSNGIEKYYFLPGDWVTGDEARLCVVMPDVTLLCPRNGDVASVQCAKLRK